jgi:hypothetical protein
MLFNDVFLEVTGQHDFFMVNVRDLEDALAYFSVLSHNLHGDTNKC